MISVGNLYLKFISDNIYFFCDSQVNRIRYRFGLNILGFKIEKLVRMLYLTVKMIYAEQWQLKHVYYPKLPS